jgi:heme oxygenase
MECAYLCATRGFVLQAGGRVDDRIDPSPARPATFPDTHLFFAFPDRTPAAAAGPVPALRAATRSHHERVDRLIDLHRIGEAAYYQRILQGFDAFLRAWEARVLAALPPARHAWLHERSRRAFLQDDLRVLRIAPLPHAAAVPALASAAAAWGSVYVMEGSALGGQVISRTLAHAGVRAWATFDALSHLLDHQLHEPVDGT